MVASIRLYVVRHGRTVAHGIFYGHDDVVLDDVGQRQAEAAATALRSAVLAAVWSSDLRRARDGATLVAAPHGLRIEETPALREMCLGILEGVPHGEALARHPELAGRSYLDMLDVRFPGGGESVRDVSERVYAWLDRALDALVDRVDRTPPKMRSNVAAAVVAHNTVARVLLGRAAGLGPAGYVRFAQRYGGISRIDLPVRDSEARPRVDWDAAFIAYANRDPLGWAPRPSAAK
jgi:broad specificity phosphatase PhoE